LDGQPVPGITSFLTPLSKALGKPYHLIANSNQSFKGACVLGTGFILETQKAQELINKEPSNKNVLFPYLNGEDLNSRFDQSPSRWIINFFDWALDSAHDDPKKPKGSPYAADYPDCLEIICDKVKPVRERDNRKAYRDYWWHYAEKRPGLSAALKKVDRVLVKAAVSPTWAFHWVSSQFVFDQKLVVLIGNFFPILQSTIHWLWSIQFGSTLGKTTYNYTPSDCFETFPFPTPDPSDLSTQLPTLNTIGETYYTHRQAVMRDRQEGLTKTYNRFHDPNETADDIQKLRELHIEMDREVANAYGWQDLDLGHDFHTTKQGIRFTISETARREVLDRLLELNHQRYAEEVAQGLHDKKKTKGKGKKGKAVPKDAENSPASPVQQSLF
jgi:hypothetical protein